MGSINSNIKVILGSMIAFMVLVLNVGCDGGSGGSKSRRAYQTPYYVDQNGYRQRNCMNCNYNNLLADAVGVVNDSVLRMEMGLSIYSNSNGYGPTDYYGNFQSYQGSFNSGNVEAVGSMYVMQDQSMLCPMPDGAYDVQTVQPGFLDGFDWTHGLILEARSLKYPATVTIRFNGAISALKDAYGQRTRAYDAFDGYLYDLGLNGNVSMELNFNGRICMVGGVTQLSMFPPSIVDPRIF